MRGHTNTSKEFWLKIDCKEINQCWEWQGTITKWGYGYFKMNRKPYRAHRLAYELTFGEIPNGLFVCHVCDNPICCNPFHLYAGTPQDNMNDKCNRNRQVHMKGEKCGKSKLTQEQVNEIKNLYYMGNYTYKKLGEIYHVHEVTIGKIIKGKLWK